MKHNRWPSILAGALLGVLPALASAAGVFDSAESADSRHAVHDLHHGSGLTWHHHLGPGANRIVVVGVSIEADDHPSSPGSLSVEFDHVPMLPVPGAMASARDRRDSLSTQLFYLLEGQLPPAGIYRVEVSFPRGVEAATGGSISLVGMAQAAPEAVAVANTDSRSKEITTTLSTITPESWLIESVAAEDRGPLVPTSADQTVRYRDEQKDLSAAGATTMAATPGPRSLGWRQHGRGRMAQVVAAFAPVTFPLSVAVIGGGSVTPAGGTFVEGATVELVATASPGYNFAGWSGDLTGTDNPAHLTMDSAKAVTATFAPDFGLYGWATENGGTTGGEGGPEVVVDTLADLRFYVQQPGPYVIKIYGTISGNENIRVYANKSILGIGSDARLRGIGLQIGWNSAYGQIGNVIIRNISFEKALAPTDNIMIAYGAKNVWVDHCDFSSDRQHGIDFYDGLLDVNHAPDFITVSWSRFHDHYKTTLVGNSDTNGAEDAGHLTVTYHHNSFINSGGRNPSVRFGLVHVYNNYFRDLDDYAVASRMGAQVVVENNWFENVKRPIRADTSLSPEAGFVSGVDTNVYLNCTPNSITTPPATWLPPYSYFLYPVDTTPDLVARWAGVGVVTFEGEPPPPTPPTVTTEPQSQTVDAGSNVSFSVSAAGSEPFSYQWSLDGSPLAGATDATLQLVNVQLTDQGSYTVEVTNRGGTVVSAPAVLTVIPPTPPAIATQPASQTALVGAAVSFSVDATGTAPLGYQWFKDGAAIPGATSSLLALLNVQLLDAGTYTVEVANAYGTALSDPATLVVDTTPTGPTVALNDAFLDGERNTQALPDSAAWFTSSGSSNLVATVGQLEQAVSSSRTLLAYVTDGTATPLTLGPGQIVTLDITFQFTGFDTGAAASDYTFRLGLLRSVANPAATTLGTWFVADGPPNTNARAAGDFGSSNPANGAFALYTGYAVFTSVNSLGTAAPILFNARNKSANNILNGNGPFTNLPAGPASASQPMEVLVPYRGVLTIEHTGSAIVLSYSVVRVSDNAVIMTLSGTDAAASMTEFDTVAFYVSKASASANYALRFNSVSITRSGP